MEEMEEMHERLEMDEEDIEEAEKQYADWKRTYDPKKDKLRKQNWPNKCGEFPDLNFGFNFDPIHESEVNKRQLTFYLEHSPQIWKII